MKSIEEMLRQLQEDVVDTQIRFEPRYYRDEGWKIRLYKNSNGVGVEIETHNDIFAVAMLDAFEQYYRIVTKGAPELLPKQIEHNG